MFTRTENHMMYGVWFLRHGMQQTEFFPHPRNNLENNNSEKMKKVFGDVIILPELKII